MRPPVPFGELANLIPVKSKHRGLLSLGYRRVSALRSPEWSQKSQATPVAREALRRSFLADPPHLWDDRWRKGQTGFVSGRLSATDDIGSSLSRTCVDSRLESSQATQLAFSYPAVDCVGDRETSGRPSKDAEASVLDDWSRLCEEGRLYDAFQALDYMAEQGCYITTEVLYRMVKACTAEKNLIVGRQVHELALKTGHRLNSFLASHIIRMYACQGCVLEAIRVFSRLIAPDKFAWSAIISAYAAHSPAEAIDLYHEMRKSAVTPDDYVYVAVLKACSCTADLTSGKLVNADLKDSIFISNPHVERALMDMYCKCGTLENARKAFDTLGSRNVATWNVMIRGYCQHAQGQEALSLYERMCQFGVQPDKRTFVGILKACLVTGAAQVGKRIHAEILERGFESDEFIGNTLVDMYAKCGKLEDARIVFDRLLTRNVVTWNAMITGYANHGLSQEAFDLYEGLQLAGVEPDEVTFMSMLKACANACDLQKGRLIHGHVVEKGFGANLSVGNTLASMYAKLGRLEDACKVFHSLPTKDVVTWNAMLEGYARQGLGKEAISLYQKMQLDDVIPDKVSFLCVIKVCASLKDMQVAKLVHERILQDGLEKDAFIGSSLVDMYAKCGSLDDARALFDRLIAKDVITWSAMIVAYFRKGLCQEALDLYDQMEADGVTPDRIAFVYALKACSSLGAVSKGRQVESHILERKLENDAHIASTLIDMHAKLGGVEDARAVFDRLRTRDVEIWNSMVGAYSQHGLADKALQLWEKMQLEGDVVANSCTYKCILKACVSNGSITEGINIHSDILRRGLDADVSVGNSLLDMYVRCKSLEAARMVFDRLPSKNLHSWKLMISGYAQSGHGLEALTLYKSMCRHGLLPDSCLFVSVVKACTHLKSISEGKEIHLQILGHRCETDVSVGNSLVDMYAKLGSLEDAYAVFASLPTKDLITWNTMLSGYAQSGLDQEAVDLFDSLQQAGVMPDKVTFMCVLKACASMGAIQKGRQLHSLIMKLGLVVDVSVANSLVDMYAKCGSLEDARAVFDDLPNKNVVTWTAMIGGYTQHEHSHEALRLYEKMQVECLEPATSITLMSLLKACADTAAIQQGKYIHDQIVGRGLDGDGFLGNTLVDMYAKCGDLESAQAIFNKLPSRDVVSWNALINGYGQHNCGSKAMQCFDKMLEHGFNPNSSTFLSLLVACSHAGLVREGEQYFQFMVNEHGIKPTLEHNCCMVDLFARSGDLSKAENLLQAGDFAKNIVGWMSLLSACKSYGDVERGRRCFDRLVQLDPQHTAAYMLMSSIYANARRWEELDHLNMLMKSAGVAKRPAHTWIEVKDKVHEFVVGEDRSDTSAKLKSLNDVIKVKGHLSDTKVILKSGAGTDKKDALCSHAEKLAVAFGLLNTPEGTTLRVIKNMRMCDDCHSGTKVVSRVERREIIIRDQHRVHHFRDGVCSCGDSY